MEDREKIISFIRTRGPVLPYQIAKEINTNILFASAMLSELTANKEILISNVKVGGSPLYYLQGQERKLTDFSDRLHEKEKKAYDLLKEKKILRDTVLEPVERVALREIHDFAKPLRVRIDQKEEIFWKWFLLPNSEAEIIIREMMSPNKTSKETKLKPVKKSEEKEKPVEKKSEGIEKQPENIQESLGITLDRSDDLLRRLSDYFQKNKIEVIDLKVIRKNSEADLIVKIPSAAGFLTYFCKAKGKKKCNDGDLSSAYLKGGSKKLPVLFITTGEVTKRAMELLTTDFKGMAFKKI